MNVVAEVKIRLKIDVAKIASCNASNSANYLRTYITASMEMLPSVIMGPPHCRHLNGALAI